jgi:glucokinase
MNELYSIGVDLGGTNLRIAAYGSGREFLDTTTLITRLAEGRQQVVRDMCDAIRATSARMNGSRRLVGIGVGTPGPLELPDGIVRNPPNLPGWDGFELLSAIETGVGCAVSLESDANLAALAEENLGVGRRYEIDSLCMITLGTGVGSGFIFNGRIWHGATGMGGEAGHIIVKDEGGALCGCGGHGCLEQYASATGIVRMAREQMHAQAPATAEELARMARAGNSIAQDVFAKVGRALAIGLTVTINTLNLPLYVLGGGVSEAWDLFSPAMLAELRSRSYIYRLTQPTAGLEGGIERHKTYICATELGPSAGLLGACILPFQTSALPENAIIGNDCP